MTTVTLKYKVEGDLKKEQFEVESIDAYQLEATLGLLKNVLLVVQENPALQDMFIALTEEEEDGEQADRNFINMAVGAFDILLIHVPEHAFNLLSILSGIEKDKLMKQKVLDLYDIYDAVLEENDIEKLVVRSKKSLAATKVKMGWAKNLKNVMSHMKQA